MNTRQPSYDRIQSPSSKHACVASERHAGPAPPRLLSWVQRYQAQIHLGAIPLLLLLTAAVYGLVYATGGVKYVYAHSMYLVILLAGFIYGMPGGALTGALAALALGPFMPIDVSTGEAQQTLNWLYRGGFFIMAGAFCGTARDCVQRYLSHIQWLRYHDSSSTLANRQALLTHLNAAPDPSQHSEQGYLAMISVENMLEMETAYGPEVSDEIILQLSRRLQNMEAGDIRTYRVNAHQLAVTLTSASNCGIEKRLTQLSDAFSRPFRFDTLSIHADITAGYTTLPGPNEDPETCLRQAETALRRAAERSQRWVRFTPELDAASNQDTLELLAELKTALGSNQLTLHYQPKICLLSDAVLGVEALMRWQHPERGSIPPGRFIPRAEHSTLIDQLTAWAIDTALAQLVTWQAQGLTLSVAVNVSTRNLLDPNFVDSVLSLLDKHQVDGALLELEITEGAFMLDFERTTAELTRLANANITLSIDDFGTGYSSLQYLDALPVSMLKIDQSFIKSLARNSSSAPIVRAAINMAHDLGIQVVAEGVETRTAFELLRELGCDVAQGYFMARPMPAAQFNDWHTDTQGYFRPG
ncbi:putative bifunctional diguanylate cyclase/phosphodiesterase [Marinobacterium rhizophilum]|uniref:GGDEF domain-containing protein n=1 Tax=Marinobacterium rhizophilum TaxID=420402 RepID=A0ABY5HQ00_9GAMM|nr:bifunctional diguanylate cyclase/phosphodiesterase [Marinobacterium rhizophilum]UTW13638.1 GGDEF domain-containing protein [Marinobacterium rhizophilum]